MPIVEITNTKKWTQRAAPPGMSYSDFLPGKARKMRLSDAAVKAVRASSGFKIEVEAKKKTKAPAQSEVTVEVADTADAELTKTEDVATTDPVAPELKGAETPPRRRAGSKPAERKGK